MLEPLHDKQEDQGSNPGMVGTPHLFPETATSQKMGMKTINVKWCGLIKKNNTSCPQFLCKF